MDEPKYKRVLLKISGEALAGEKHFGLDFQVLGQVADVIKECVNTVSYTHLTLPTILRV